MGDSAFGVDGMLALAQLTGHLRYAILILLFPQANKMIGSGRFCLLPVGRVVENARCYSSVVGAAPYTFAPDRSISSAAFGCVPHEIEGTRIFGLARDCAAERCVDRCIG